MSVFTRKIRGFRLVDMVGLGLLIAIILGVYLAKTVAGRERAEIAKIERQIKSERQRIRLLQAEVAHLEQPGRIERLAVAYLKLEPVTANRETEVEKIVEVARAGPPAKQKALSAVAGMVTGADIIPGVPPPPPPEGQVIRYAEASR
jgi:cell division protein FtsL